MNKISMLFLLSAVLSSNALENESFCGIGLIIQMEQNGAVVESIVSDSPVEKSGIKVGDIIIAVDEKSLIGVPLNQAVEYFRDVKNKPIELTYVSKRDTLNVVLRRTELTVRKMESKDNPVAEIKNKKFISVIEINEGDFGAVYVDDSTDFGAFARSTSKKKNVKFVEFNKNVITYEVEKKDNVKKNTINLNGKAVSK